MIITLPAGNMLRRPAGQYESKDLLDELSLMYEQATSDPEMWPEHAISAISARIKYVRNLVFLATPPAERGELLHPKRKRRRQRPDDPDEENWNQHLDAAGWETVEVDDTKDWVRYFTQRPATLTKSEPDLHKDGQVIQFDNIMIHDAVVYDIDDEGGVRSGTYWNEETNTYWYVTHMDENRWYAQHQKV